MIFNSLAFIIFWIIFTLFFIRSWKENSKYLLIIIFSLFFYGFWKWEFIFLIILSGVIDFFAGLMIRKGEKKKVWLFASILTNIGILFSFKYLPYYTNLEGTLFATLPIGISFYTFQSMSYTIDVYRGHLKATNNFLKFFAYLSMFPQLVAGPIVRARDLLDQLQFCRLQRGEELYFGLKLISFGFFKKMVIADGVASFVNIAFSNNPTFPDSSLYWWCASLCFALQIYCDFSGYSDIARGLARIYGINFPLNFNHPYLATSFKDFWSRWHISLSSWFKDYIYIPLGGNRSGHLRSHFNMWLTMLISGLWHGANYTFLIWGGIHALFLSGERLLTPLKIKTPKLIKLSIVFSLILVSWVFFRAESLTQAIDIVIRMFSFSGLDHGLDNWLLFIIALFFLRELSVFFKLKFQTLNKLEPVWVGALAALAFFLRGDGNIFIYFQF